MFKQYIPVILASKSPRRQELLASMNIQFSLLLKEVDENYPAHLQPAEVAMYISEKKAKAYADESVSSIVITADTIVAFNQEILGKPRDTDHAREILGKLSGNKHEVYTGVSVYYNKKLHTFFDKTEVFFRGLSTEQIEFYIEHYNPFDKAGAYGVQDWIGMIAVEKIVGSYTNVMGLPTEKLYRTLCDY